MPRSCLLSVPGVALAAVILTAAHAQDVTPGYQHFYNLDFDLALAQFEKAAVADPSNPATWNHIAHTILYAEMLRNGALESEMVSGTNTFLRREGLNPSAENERKFTESVAKSIELCEARLQAKPDDKPALYALGVAHGLKANYDFLVRKSWSDALSSAGKARKYHEKVTELDPEYVDAYLLQGIHQYVVGSLPRTLRFVGFFMGFRGDRNKGIELLKKVEIFGKENRIDAQVLLATIYRRERRAAEAIPLLSVLGDRFPRNYLLQFEMLQMYSDLGDKQRSLDMLDQIAKKHSLKSDGWDRVPRERVDYARGNFLFWYREYPQALVSMEAATAGASKLTLATAALAWMRLGQIRDMLGKHKEAVNAYDEAYKLAPKSDIGKESKGYKSKPYRRTD
jgi:tetratricopeptide (TPR) repeat protein